MTIDEKIEIVRQYYKAFEKSDADALDTILPDGFKTVEVDRYGGPIEGLDQFRAQAANRTPGIFEFADIDAIGDALIVDSRWTPDGGTTERWRSVWTFWKGELERIDSKRLGYVIEGSAKK